MKRNEDLGSEEDEYYLQKEKYLTYPDMVLFFDTETKMVKISSNEYECRLKLGGYILYSFFENKEICRKIFYSKEDFISDLMRFVDKYNKLTIIAHNIDFDIKVLSLVSLILEKGFKFYREPILENLVIIRFVKKIKNNNTKNNNNTKINDDMETDDDENNGCKYDKKFIEVIDSFNIFKDSLDNLAKSIGCRKIDINFDTCTNKELEIYCMNDVEILNKLFINLMKFLRENNISFKPTISSIALSCYRNNFLQKISINTPYKIRELERLAYKGGRVECFVIGKVLDDVYYLDINSLYPYMACFDLPVEFKSYRENINLRYLDCLMEKYYVIANVDFSIYKNCVGVKRKIDKTEKLIFPVGNIKNEFLHQPEIKLVKKFGEIKKINSVLVYEKGKPLKNYMEHFYKLKQENKQSSNYLFYKLLMNSLYGKFGQRTRIVRVVKYLELDDGCYNIVFPNLMTFDTKTNNTKGIIYDKLYCRVINRVGYVYMPSYVYAPHSNVALAGSITAYGRCYLFNAMMTAGLENCYYCDTDSLMLNKLGYDNLVANNYVNEQEMGKFKLEKIGNVSIYNLKWYEFNEKLKIKGVKNLNRKGFIEEGKKISESLSVVEYLQERVERLKSAIRNKRYDKQIVELFVKKLDKNYKKGVVQNETNKSYSIVAPIQLKEF